MNTIAMEIGVLDNKLVRNDVTKKVNPNIRSSKL